MKNLITLLLISTLAIVGCRKEDGVFDIKPKHFLSDDNYNSLTIEVLAVEGHEPNAEALENLKTFLQERLHKPGGINFVQKTIPSPNNNSFTASDLRDLEDEVRSEYADRDQLAGYIFYADAGFSEDTDDSKVLGVAYSSTSMCIFEETVDAYSGGFGEVSREELETAVLIHEFCHVLGLVNNGTPMAQNHEDPNNPGHCDNENCLMYYASKTSSLPNILGGGEMPTLDSQCIEDLRKSGGK